MLRSTVWFVPLALMACGPDLESDEDADGLTLGQEQDLGTDPSKADSDGDGLADAQEVDLGTDPTKNSYEAPYKKGSWPRQAVEIKDAIEAEGRSGAEVDVGKRFPRVKVQNQFGEQFDLYDLARQGKPIVVDVSAEWCGPCNAMSGYLAGDEYYTQALGMDGALKKQIDNGNLFWVTFMSEDVDYAAPTLEVVQRWDEAYPAEPVPVLLDKKQEMIDYVITPTNAWPSMVRLDEDMKVKQIGGGIDVELIDKAVSLAKEAAAGGGGEEE
jgi:thiol-disulfide isomerase/thioredoxin